MKHIIYTFSLALLCLCQTLTAQFDIATSSLLNAQKYYNNQQFQAAIQSLHINLTTSPNHQPSINLLAEFYTMQGAYKSAIALYSTLLTQDPYNVAILKKRALLYHKIGYNDFALSDMLSLASYQPNSEIYFNISQLYSLQGEDYFALNAIKKAAAFDPYNIDIKKRLAILEAKLNKSEKAIEIYTEIAHERSLDVTSYINKALIHIKTENYQHAIETLNKALKITPADYKIWLHLAQCHFETSQPYKALNMLDQALEFEKNEPEIYFLQGLINYKMQRYQRATYPLERSCEIAEFKNLNYASYLVKSYYMQGEYINCIHAVDTYAKNNKNVPDILQKFQDSSYDLLPNFIHNTKKKITPY